MHRRCTGEETRRAECRFVTLPAASSRVDRPRSRREPRARSPLLFLPERHAAVGSQQPAKEAQGGLRGECSDAGGPPRHADGFARTRAHALRALHHPNPPHPAADPAAAAATHKKKSIGLGDEVKVWLKYTHTHVHTGAGEWLDAKVLRVDEAIGLYCVGLSGTFCIWVVLEQLRLVAAAAKPTIAKELATDAAELADIETWDEGTLRANQNTCSARTQGLIKIIRDRRNAAKRWCDGLARVAERRREMKERFAAEAPARAAAKAAKAERRRAEKARPPPPTRASHPRPKFALRALGGSKRAPDDAPPGNRGNYYWSYSLTSI